MAFDKNMWRDGRKAESSKKGTGEHFFSSKNDNENFFNASVGEISIVGLQTLRGDGKEIKPFNVVIFSDGHQLSTSRFFAAKGVKWPVGGSIAKWDYLAAKAAAGSLNSLRVTPVEVKIGEERSTTDGRKFTPVTYVFEEVEFPTLSQKEEEFLSAE